MSDKGCGVAAVLERPDAYLHTMWAELARRSQDSYLPSQPTSAGGRPGQYVRLGVEVICAEINDDGLLQNFIKNVS